VLTAQEAARVVVVLLAYPVVKDQFEAVTTLAVQCYMARYLTVHSQAGEAE